MKLQDNNLKRIAFCNEVKGKIKDALDDYLFVECMDKNDPWTLKHISICLRRLKKTKLALEYIDRAVRIAPDDIALIIETGKCYLARRKYDEALKHYFKAEYLSDGAKETLRPIAHCFFLMWEFDRALEYHHKILARDPEPKDVMNLAHTLQALGRKSEAEEYYFKSARMYESPAGFFWDMEDDAKLMEKVGVTYNELSIIASKISRRMVAVR